MVARASKIEEAFSTIHFLALHIEGAVHSGRTLSTSMRTLDLPNMRGVVNMCVLHSIRFVEMEQEISFKCSPL